MDIRAFFSKKRRVEEKEKIDHEQPHSSKQMEVQDTIPAPTPIETGKLKLVGNVNYGIPSDIAQIGEPIKRVILDIHISKRK